MVKRILIFLLLPLFLLAQELRLKVGTYTGNGTTQSITGVGFQPKVVILKGNIAGHYMVWKSSAHVGDTCAVGRGVDIVNGITSLDADGFTVADSAAVNNNTTVYSYLALGGSSITTGAYTGTGANIAQSTTWQPSAVMLHQRDNATGETLVKMAEMADGYSSGVLTPTLTGVTLQPSGFESHSTWSTSGKKYTWFAIQSDDLFYNDTTYTGDGVTNHIETTFPISVVILKRNTAANAFVWRTTTYPSTTCGHWWNTVDVGGTIQAITDNTFELSASTNSNGSGATYYAFYLREYVASAAAEVRKSKYNGLKSWSKH